MNLQHYSVQAQHADTHHTFVFEVKIAQRAYIDLASHVGQCEHTECHYTIKVIIGDGAVVTVSDDALNQSLKAHHVQRTIEYHVGEYAQLTVAQSQNVPLTVQEKSVQRFICNAHSNINYSTIMLGAGMATEEIIIELAGVGASGSVRGAYILGGAQRLLINTQQLHTAPSTRSDVLVKGCLFASAHADYQGMIAINKNGAKSNAHQQNKNILMGEKATVVSTPSLEVLTDDVQCGHGTAIGQLDKAALLYAQSRGLSHKQAQRFLLDGFLADSMSDKISDTIIQQIADKIDQGII